MADVIASFPESFQTDQTVELGDVQYRITLTWRVRNRAWYVDIRLLDGTDVALGRRLSPSFGPLFMMLPPNAPEGILYVTGRDPYRMDDLGESVRLDYYGPDELPEAEATSTPITTRIL